MYRTDARLVLLDFEDGGRREPTAVHITTVRRDIFAGRLRALRRGSRRGPRRDPPGAEAGRNRGCLDAVLQRVAAAANGAVPDAADGPGRIGVLRIRVHGRRNGGRARAPGVRSAPGPP